MIRAASCVYGAIAVLAGVSSVNAATQVADSPLFLTVSVPPNIVLTLDDSGSMAKAFVPDICGTGSSQYNCATLNNRYAKSAHYNSLYYNPHVKYPAPKNASGQELTTSFEDAYRNGFDPNGGLGKKNLNKAYRPTASLDFPMNTSSGTELYAEHYSDDVRCTSSSPYRCQIRNGPGANDWFTTETQCTGTNNSQRNTSCRTKELPAYYYVFDSTNANCTPTNPADNDCYDIVIVSETSGPATVDLNGDGVINAADADERQNFANWYSFARTRHLATQTAASLAFSDLSPDVRVGWQALNSCRGSSSSLVTTSCRGWKNNDMSNVTNAIRPFTGQHRQNFYHWLSRLPTDSTTPLPDAMYRVGEYYRTGGENSPYDNDFTTNNSGELACRRNYHVMMTDGIWNDARSSGNRDGNTLTLPETVDGVSQYSPIAPYKDSYSNTLADLAFYYWATDLRNSLDNEVLPNYRDRSGQTAAQNFWNPRNDPATWQHMVNFMIGLGLTNYLAQEGLTWDGNMYTGSYPAIASGSLDWPQPGTNDPANVADLWHAAINSRGQFFSADDPASLSNAFRAALNAITEASGSSAALSANSTSLTGTTLVYQAKFNNDWTGTVLALPVGVGGAVSQSPKWDASKLIPSHSSRRIFTYDGSKGVEFSSCSNLSEAQRKALNTDSTGWEDNLCEARLAWLRGDHKDEMRSTTTGSLKRFRNRPDTVMGDIINSDPAFVKDSDYGYSGLPAGTPGQSTYDAYRAANATRTPMIYVGANDGRMYAIRGDADEPDSGVEKFSYIPAGVYHNLSYLTDPLYTHRYYADGSIIARDAYLDGSWRTVVAAGLNAGGRSIYALDVTDPENFSEKNVLWEFQPEDDVDIDGLGLTFSRPQIGILESGQWVAIFGNGYNSPSGGAYLYVVDLATGALIKRITVQDDTSIDENNGLSTPILVDTDGNKKIDRAYAGDLHGNLWKIDLSGTSANWGVVNNRPMFRARVGSTPQPITAQPKVAAHPSHGLLVFFGTGRYLSNSDVFDTSRQSYYGIWDNNSWTTTAQRSDLQAQEFDLQADYLGREVRSITGNTVDWAGGRRGWYIDLLDGTGQGGTIGERVVTTSLVVRDLVIFSSIIPSTDPCKPGGTSWIFALKYDTGGTTNRMLFDLDGDGVFDSNANGEFVGAVRTERLGISNVPVLVVDDPTPTDPTDDAVAIADTGYLIGTGTTGETETNMICLNTAGCSTAPPPSGPVTRRSWIQIR